MPSIVDLNLPKLLVRKKAAECSEDSSSKELLLESEQRDAERDESKPFFQDTHSSASLLNTFCVLVCIACATLSWYNSFSHPLSVQNAPFPTDNYRTVHRSKYNSLRRPSPFIGFDYLPRSKPAKPRRLVNFPVSISLVNASNVDQVFSDDPGSEWTETGLISREDRTVMISPSVSTFHVGSMDQITYIIRLKVSTIVQFRAVDYGMERCILTIRMSSATTDVLDVPRGVSIHRLDASHGPLDLKKLSYSNRPTRISTMGALQVSPGTLSDWQTEFHCMWDTLHIFEFGYTGQAIDEYRDNSTFTIQWSQNKEEEDPDTGTSSTMYSYCSCTDILLAIFLVQRESI
ncbi:hypothetical protein JR316_0012766 [Psilocybe cubensis]|uniref:Uncharacterized protein n=2 Tax=Psilocybe cubensis TaxID=181762 RepID=A0ACB8GFE4_PSICU|nr:hypothetical protein JR316_0012766 [Psilocybe cubensis]KAH9474308.1 hypothetical protein JR316_0012766 [Psilocybe cubensis]